MTPPGVLRSSFMNAPTRLVTAPPLGPIPMEEDDNGRGGSGDPMDLHSYESDRDEEQDDAAPDSDSDTKAVLAAADEAFTKTVKAATEIVANSTVVDANVKEVVEAVQDQVATKVAMLRNTFKTILKKARVSEETRAGSARRKASRVKKALASGAGGGGAGPK